MVKPAGVTQMCPGQMHRAKRFPCGYSVAIIARQGKGKYSHQQLVLKISSVNLENQLCRAFARVRQMPVDVSSSAS